MSAPIDRGYALFPDSQEIREDFIRDFLPKLAITDNLQITDMTDLDNVKLANGVYDVHGSTDGALIVIRNPSSDPQTYTESILQILFTDSAINSRRIDLMTDSEIIYHDWLDHNRNYVPISDIIADLLTNDDTKPLAASMGVELKALIDGIVTLISGIEAGVLGSNYYTKIQSDLALKSIDRLSFFNAIKLLNIGITANGTSVENENFLLFNDILDAWFIRMNLANSTKKPLIVFSKFKDKEFYYAKLYDATVSIDTTLVAHKFYKNVSGHAILDTTSGSTSAVVITRLNVGGAITTNAFTDNGIIICAFTDANDLILLSWQNTQFNHNITQTVPVGAVKLYISNFSSQYADSNVTITGTGLKTAISQLKICKKIAGSHSDLAAFNANINNINIDSTDVALMKSGNRLLAYNNGILAGGANIPASHKSKMFGGIGFKSTDVADNDIISTWNIQKRPEAYAAWSVDDVYYELFALNSLTGSTPSIFDTAFFAFWKSMHDQYGVRVVMNCYWSVNDSGTIRTLNNITTAYKAEFQANSDWLHFSFHGADATTPYGATDGNNATIMTAFNNTCAAIINFAGFECLDTVIRPHMYDGNKTLWNSIKNGAYGLKAIYAAEDDRIAGALSASEIGELVYCNDYIDFSNSMYYIKSCYRYDGKTAVTGLAQAKTQFANTPGVMGLYVHASSLASSSTNEAQAVAAACGYLYGKIRFDFVENNLPNL